MRDINYFFVQSFQNYEKGYKLKDNRQNQLGHKECFLMVKLKVWHILIDVLRKKTFILRCPKIKGETFKFG